MTEEKKKYPKRGLASIPPERRREIQSMGGKSVPRAKRAFNDRALARKAGKLGAKARNSSSVDTTTGEI